MHCYFHLVGDHEIVPDETGVEVPSLEAARDWALEVIQEASREVAADHGSWAGWSVVITDAAGTVLCTISLDRQPFRAGSEAESSSHSNLSKATLRTLRPDWQHGKALPQ